MGSRKRALETSLGPNEKMSVESVSAEKFIFLCYTQDYNEKLRFTVPRLPLMFKTIYMFFV